MILVIAINIIAVGWLLMAAVSWGLEETLPGVAFMLLLLPQESQITLPSLFGLSTHRILIFVLVLLYLALGSGKGKREQTRRLPLCILIGLQIVWMLLSSATSIVPSISFKTSLSQFFDFFVLYMIFASVVSKVETVHKIMFGFVAAMFVCSIFGMLEAYSGWSVMSLFPSVPLRFSDLEGTVQDRGIRMQATFDHPILFGSALTMVFPMALYLLAESKQMGRKAFLWAALLLAALCIYKTGSRGPWLAFALSIGLLLLAGRGKVRKYAAVIMLLVLVVLAVRPGIRESLSNSYNATRDPSSPEGQSYQWRYLLYHVAFGQLEKSTERSLLGFGPESFYYLGLTAPFLVDGEIHTVKIQSCDSAVVELLMDTGYVGLILTVLPLLTACGFALRRHLRLEKKDSSPCAVWFVVIFLFMFLMTNVELYGWGQQNYALWIVVAMAMISPRLERENRDEAKRILPQSQWLEVTAP